MRRYIYLAVYSLTMILKDALREIVKRQRASLESSEYGVERELAGKVELGLPYALVISGVRRCGKSTLLRQLTKRLPRYYYLHFEDPLLSAFEPEDFGKLDDVFREEYGDREYYLLDEVQNVKSWEVFVRSRLDAGKKFLITGSNASLLSRELGTRLTGRHLNIELFPFSFGEMLLLKKRRANLDSFDEYLVNGGFPEYLRHERQEIPQRLFTDIIQRDIVARHGIRDAKTLEELALYLLTNIGKEFSYNGLAKTFGLGSVNTAISFVSYLEDSYLLFTVPRIDFSPKKRVTGQKKVYSIDNGLSGANSVSFSSDAGRMLENAVFLALRRKHKDIFYFAGKKECDFLVKEKGKITMAVQVTYELNSDNKDRELEGMVEAMEKFGLEEGLLLTRNQEDSLKVRGKRIAVRPVWKWIGENP